MTERAALIERKLGMLKDHMQRHRSEVYEMLVSAWLIGNGVTATRLEEQIYQIDTRLHTLNFRIELVKHPARIIQPEIGKGSEL